MYSVESLWKNFIHWRKCYRRYLGCFVTLLVHDSKYIHRPLARYVKLRVAHAPGMPGTFSPPPQVSDPDMHHGTCVTPVPCCIPGSLTSGFHWSQWRGKSSRYSQRMRNPQFFVYGNRPKVQTSNIYWTNNMKKYWFLDEHDVWKPSLKP